MKREEGNIYMRLETWIKESGGAIKVAKALKTTPYCIWFWLRGERTPRPKMMLKIHKLSKGKVSLETIIKETSR